MVKGGTLEDHLAMFKEIFTYLGTLEVKYDDKDLASIILC